MTSVADRSTRRCRRRNRPGRLTWLAVALSNLCLFAISNATAGPLYYLKKNELFCDDAKLLCVRGTLRYEVNPRLFRLWGRVQTSPGRGLLRIRLNGTNRLDYLRTTMMEIQLRGTYSEIVDYKMIPDHPDVEDWEVVMIEFEPGEKSPPAESRH